MGISLVLEKFNWRKCTFNALLIVDFENIGSLFVKNVRNVVNMALAGLSERSLTGRYRSLPPELWF